MFWHVICFKSIVGIIRRSLGVKIMTLWKEKWRGDRLSGNLKCEGPQDASVEIDKVTTKQKIGICLAFHLLTKNCLNVQTSFAGSIMNPFLKASLFVTLVSAVSVIGCQKKEDESTVTASGRMERMTKNLLYFSPAGVDKEGGQVNYLKNNTYECPENTWAVGFNIQIENYRGVYDPFYPGSMQQAGKLVSDDTGINGIKLICADISWSTNVRPVLQADGIWGSYQQNDTMADSFSFLVGASVRAHYPAPAKQDKMVDYKGITGVAFLSSAGFWDSDQTRKGKKNQVRLPDVSEPGAKAARLEQFEPNNPLGQWQDDKTCPAGTAIAGMSIQSLGRLPAGFDGLDKVGIQSVMFFCDDYTAALQKRRDELDIERIEELRLIAADFKAELRTLIPDAGLAKLNFEQFRSSKLGAACAIKTNVDTTIFTPEQINDQVDIYFSAFGNRDWQSVATDCSKAAESIEAYAGCPDNTTLICQNRTAYLTKIKRLKDISELSRMYIRYLAAEFVHSPQRKAAIDGHGFNARDASYR